MPTSTKPAFMTPGYRDYPQNNLPPVGAVCRLWLYADSRQSVTATLRESPLRLHAEGQIIRVGDVYMYEIIRVTR